MELLREELLEVVSTADMLVKENKGEIRLIWDLPENINTRKEAIVWSNTNELMIESLDSCFDDGMWHLSFDGNKLSEESIRGIENLR
jgi:hypothetical protein